MSLRTERKFLQLLARLRRRDQSLYAAKDTADSTSSNSEDEDYDTAAAAAHRPRPAYLKDVLAQQVMPGSVAN